MREQIRLAQAGDCDSILELLRAIAALHREGRPDLFREGASKYSKEELLELFQNPNTPVFVAEADGRVAGYAFCQVIEHKNDGALNDMTTLYLDDLCVDEGMRGQGLGKKLFEHVKEYAVKQGCYSVDLNVWAFNTSARSFYERLGMQEKKRCMELIL